MKTFKDIKRNNILKQEAYETSKRFKQNADLIYQESRAPGCDFAFMFDMLLENIELSTKLIGHIKDQID